jgi:DNA repair protein RecN (Recombination protein N)
LLSQLRIKNLAVVEDVTLDFDEGLNVLTGSTGAGKSLILGAVNVLLGRRAGPAMIRAGEESAVVEAVFETPAVPRRPGGTVVGRREIKRSGRSFAWLDGKAVPLKELQQTCARWIEPHGQNEQLRLRNPDTHIDYLDAFGGHDDLLESYRAAHAAFVAAEEELHGFDRRMALLKEKEELLRHRIDEIERARVERGELEELEASIRLMENSERVFEALGFVFASLEGDAEGESGATVTLARAIRQLSRVAEVDPRIAAFVSQLEEAELSLRDCADGVRSYLDNFEFDAERLQTMELRRSYLLDLERRYDMSADELVAKREEWARELSGLSFEDEERAALQRRCEEARAAIRSAAGRLRARRIKSARGLDTEMTRELEALMISGARFRSDVGYEAVPDGPLEVEGRAAAAFANGGDVVRFWVRTNPGESEGPVDEIASTGEISRISLAIKKAVGARRGRGGQGAVLVFDELDAGVGADLGGVIAEKLLELGAGFQIICITHMPQIAAAARRHLVVAKRSRGGRTTATVAPVDGKDRRREIARMLGGEEGSDKRTALAGELLAGRSQTKRP